MATLDRVMQLQQQGYSDEDIGRLLQSEGVSPAQITDALGQARVKSAVSGAEENVSEPLPEIAPSESVDTSTGAPPIPPPLDNSVASQPQQYAPQDQGQQYADQYAQGGAQQQYADQYAQGQQYAPQNQGQQYTDQYAQGSGGEYYPQTPQAYDQYGGQEYYGGQGVSDMQTVSDLANQVVSEKLEDFRKEVGDIRGFHEMIQEQVDRIDSRLKKIEDTISHLNRAVIGRIGEFGESSALIHKDLDNLHNTVSKLMGHTIDEHRKSGSSHHSSSHHHRSHASKKKKKK